MSENLKPVIKVKKAASKAAIPYQAKNYLLAIAINDYEHVPKLYNCINDAEKLITLLTEEFEFEDENVRFICSGENSEEFKKKYAGRIEILGPATEEAILRQLRDMGEQIRKGQEEDSELKANLVLYYSGHGEYDKFLEMGYWIPVDAKQGDYFKYIPNSTIRDFLSRIPTHHTLLLSDSCFSGSLFASGQGKSIATTRLEKDPSRWGITAGRNEVVSDGELGGNSPFAASLLGELKKSETIAVQDLSMKVLERVAADDKQTPRGEPLRIPGHEGGQFIFRKKANARRHFEAGLLLMELANFQPEYERFRSAANQFALARRLTKKEGELVQYACWEARALCAAGPLEAAAEVLEKMLSELKSPELGKSLREQLGYVYILQGMDSRGLGIKEMEEAQKKAFNYLRKLPENPDEKSRPALISWILKNLDDPKLAGMGGVNILDVLYGPVRPWTIKVLSELAEAAGDIPFSPVELLHLNQRFALFGAHKEAVAFFERSGFDHEGDEGIQNELEGAHSEPWRIRLSLALCYIELDALEKAAGQLKKCGESEALKSKTEVFSAVQRLQTKVKENLEYYHTLTRIDPYARANEPRSGLAVAGSPDGRRLLSGSKEGNTALVWNADGDNGQLILEGHASRVIAVAFCPDSQYMLTGSEDNTAKLWKLDGELLQTLKGHAGPVAAVAFSPDGRQLLTGSDDSTASLWSLEGQALQSFAGHAGPIAAVAFSPDGQQLLTGSADNTMKLWNGNGELLDTFQNYPETDRILSVAFSPDGQWIVAGCAENTAKLWSRDDKKSHVFQDESPVVAVAFSADGRHVVTSTDDNTGRLWDAESGALLLSMEQGKIQSSLAEPEAVSKALLEDIRSRLQEHLDKGNENLRVDLGVTFGLLGRPEEALEELKKAEALQDPDAHYPLARILLEQKSAEGYNEEENAAGNEPDSGPSWTAVANYLRNAIDYDPANTPAYYYLGKAILGLVKDESFKTAAEIYNQYLAAGAPIGHREEVQEFINSQNKELQKEAAITRGRKALAAGQAENSIAAFEEAIRLGDQASHYHLGRALEGTGNLTGAVEAYRQAIKAGVKEPELRKRFGKAVDALFGDLNLLKEGANALSDAQNKEEEAAKTRLLRFTNTVAEYSLKKKQFVLLSMGQEINERLKTAWDYTNEFLWTEENTAAKPASLELAPLEEGSGYLIRDLSENKVVVQRTASAGELVSLAIRDLQRVVAPIRYQMVYENGQWMSHCGLLDGLPLGQGQVVQVDIINAERDHLPPARASVGAIGFRRSSIRLSEEGSISEVGWYDAIVDCTPPPPIRIWVHGEQKGVESIRQLCRSLNKNILTVARPSLFEEVQLEIEAAGDSFIIHDRENNQRALETQGADTRALADALSKIINWKRALGLHNGQSGIQQNISLEMQVIDKNRKSTYYTEEEVALAASPEAFLEKDGALFAGFVPRVRIKGTEQELYCYLFHLRSNYSIEAYEGEVVFRPEEHKGNEEAVLPLWKSPKGWGLSPGEQKAFSCFLLLASTEALDYRQLVQSGLEPTRGVQFGWNPLAVSDWCSKRMRVRLVRS